MIMFWYCLGYIAGSLARIYLKIIRICLILMILMTAVMALKVWAEDNNSWVCTEQASQVHGSEIYACGIGIGKTENDARAQAFDNAKAEYERVCNASDNCRGRQVKADPRRLTCEPAGAAIKCYRMVVFSIDQSDPSKKPEKSNAFRAPGKIRKGMTKDQLISAFGMPKSVEDSGYGVRTFMFKGKMCDSDLCFVHIKDEKIESYYQINPELMGDI
jgi:hypothetical protein